MNNTQETIEGLVRDLCSVVPVPKSEARRRIENHTSLALQKQRKEIVEMLDKAKHTSGGGKCAEIEKVLKAINNLDIK
ncbi:hypothetical protein N8148_03020 [Gammaproteobacteria bacterium]|nr:hypothetical protein [Gammaproteobacteria bacterium]